MNFDTTEKNKLFTIIRSKGKGKFLTSPIYKSSSNKIKNLAIFQSFRSRI